MAGKSKMDAGWKVVLLACAGFAVAFAWLLFAPTRPESNQAESASTETAPPYSLGDEVRRIGNLSLGYVGVLSGKGMIVLAKTPEDYSALSKAIEANDATGMDEILGKGSAFEVPSGTSAKLLDRDLGGLRVRVRVASGKFAEAEGWVSSDYFR